MSYSDKRRTDVEQMFLNEMMEEDLDDSSTEDEYDALMDDLIGEDAEDYDDGSLF